jgi:TRAP-type mannitol/chloroaromatic compound transport system substrate-binding protein
LGIISTVGGIQALEPPETWGFSSVAIESLDDIKGLKMRLGSPIHREILNRMGMSTVYIPGSEVYESIQRGVIDMAEYLSPSTNWVMGFHEVAKYHYLSSTRSPFGYSGFFIRKAAWEELTPELQLVVEMAAFAEPMKTYPKTIVADGEAIQKYIDYGTNIGRLPHDVEEELIKVAAEYYDEQAAGDPFYAQVLESRRAFKHLCELQDIR